MIYDYAFVKKPKDYDIKLIKTCIEVVVSFAVVASILTLKTIEDRKKIKQKNK